MKLTKKFTAHYFLLLLTISLFNSCAKKDDDIDMPPISETELAAMRETSTQVLTTSTSGSSKVWKISEAYLVDDDTSTEIEITSNFNIIDDEFIFTGTGSTGTLEWRKGYDVNTEATNSSETLLDNYVSPIITAFNYQEGSSTTIEADFGSCTFTLNEDGTLYARITNPNNTSLNFVLDEKGD